MLSVPSLHVRSRIQASKRKLAFSGFWIQKRRRRKRERSFSSQESPGPHISLHVTPLMQRLCSIRKGVGKTCKASGLHPNGGGKNMHVKPQRSCKATVKSTEYARAGNHEAVISRPMTLLLWEREPVDVLCIWRLSENNFAP